MPKTEKSNKHIKLLASFSSQIRIRLIVEKWEIFQKNARRKKNQLSIEEVLKWLDDFLERSDISYTTPITLKTTSEKCLTSHSPSEMNYVGV